jgi:hypothetical protein
MCNSQKQPRAAGGLRAAYLSGAEGWGGFHSQLVMIHLTVMGQLSHWISGNALEPEDLHVVRVEKFLKSRRPGGQDRVPNARMFTALLDHLTAEGVVSPTPSPSRRSPWRRSW